jgi:hypothetical protein
MAGVSPKPVDDAVEVLYRGTDRIKERGVLCVPVDAFLRRLTPGQAVSAALGLGPGDSVSGRPSSRLS